MFNISKTIIKKKKETKTGYALVALYTLSLTIRTLYLAMDPLIMRDAATYLTAAENWFNSNSYVSAKDGSLLVPPFPIWIIKETMLLGFGVEVSGRFINIFAGSIAPLAVFFLIKSITHKNYFSLAVGLLTSLNPNLVSYSIQPLRENLYFLFGIIALVLLVKSTVRDIFSSELYYFFCAFFCVLCLFCRYEAAELFLLCLAVKLLQFIHHKIFSKLIREMFIYGLGTILSFIILFLVIDCDLSFTSRIKAFILS